MRERGITEIPRSGVPGRNFSVTISCRRGVRHYGDEVAGVSLPTQIIGEEVMIQDEAYFLNNRAAVGIGSAHSSSGGISPRA